MQIKPSAALPFTKPIQNLHTQRPFTTPTPARPMTKPLAMTTLSELPHRPYTPAKPTDRVTAAKDPSALSFTPPIKDDSSAPNALQTEVIGAPQPPAGAPMQLTLDGLVSAWGSADPNYDFDGNGVVGVPDLLQMIENLKKFQSESIPSAGLDDSTNATIAESNVESGDTPVDELAPETDKPQVATTPEATDANGANVESPATDVEPAPIPDAMPSPDAPAPSSDAAIDLRAYVNSLVTGDSRKPMIAGLNGAGARTAIAPDALRGRASVHALGGLKPMADSLFNHLSGAGFADQPPTNIRELVDALNLAPRQTEFLLKQLAMKYPAGLGVNMVG